MQWKRLHDSCDPVYKTITLLAIINMMKWHLKVTFVMYEVLYTWTLDRMHGSLHFTTAGDVPRRTYCPSLAWSCYIRCNTHCCVAAAGYDSPWCYHKRESFSTILSTLARSSYPEIIFPWPMHYECRVVFFNQIIPSFRQLKNICL